MIGIYKITNNINNKIYIGQSINIERRWSEHLTSGKADREKRKKNRNLNTPIHLAMYKYKIENFSLSILEECSPEELDEKEKYWINYYDSTNKTKGYNVLTGGQEKIALKGEQHSQAKLTEEQVNQIRDLLINTDKSLVEINDLFPFVSKSTISMINTGKRWKDENLSYPLRRMTSSNGGAKKGYSLLTIEEAMDIRIKYSQGWKPKDIIPLYQDKISDNGIKAILYGQSYKYLPIWNNVKKEWVEPCIDYPQSLNKAGE